MKHLSNSPRWLLLLALATSGHFAAQAQSVGIGTTTPDASVVLDLKSTAQGLLLPRMTSVQREYIANPAYSLLVFQTDNTPGIYYFNGTIWVNLVSGSPASPDPTTGVVTTLAGSGTAGYADGTGPAAQFNLPTGVAYDGSGNLYVADYNNHRIRRIVAATGAVSTLAGGTRGSADGTGPAAQFTYPSGVAWDGSGNLYVADTGNHRIRKIVAATGEVTTLTGSGTAGYADGTGPAASFNSPYGVACDGSGNLYVADKGNHRIRSIVAATGAVSTLAGSPTGTAGYADGTGAAAQFRYPYGVACDASGTVYVADEGNNRIRVVK